MPAAIALCKFVGTISLGLLTGVSYTLSTQSLPSLLTLPSAKPAAHTLAQTTRLSTLHISTLSTLSASSLLLAYFLSPSRLRHPYLIWTALVAGASGALQFAVDRQNGGVKGKARNGNESEEDWEKLGDSSTQEMNGEQVEKRAREQQFVEFIRTGVAGVGFAMGVVGVWGDGA